MPWSSLSFSDEKQPTLTIQMTTLTILIPLLGILALVYTFWRSQWVAKQPPGLEVMERIAAKIKEGAMTFLRTEYKVLSLFVGCVAILLVIGGLASESSHPLVGVSFIVGAFCSALSGYIGMRIATRANVRTTNGARTGLGEGLKIAFTGGSVMGMGVVGLAVLGLGTLFLIYSQAFGTSAEAMQEVMTIIAGFSFGASSIALFACVVGEIYTKAVDVGSALVGKVVAGIPEDHPWNPATIADSVGDNVCGVTGKGADLFDSYVGAIVATMVWHGVHSAAGLRGSLAGSAACCCRS